MKRVLFVLSTPSEVVQLAPIIYLLQHQHGGAIETRWIDAGSNGPVVQRTAKVFHLEADGHLPLAGRNLNLSDDAWSVNQAIHRAIDSWMPDLLVVQGASSFAVVAAQQAFVRRIPVLHVLGGIRLINSMLKPQEQANRRMLNALANFRCVSSVLDQAVLRQEGFAGYEIGVTGNPALDALGFLGHAGPSANPYLSQHPEDVSVRLQTSRLLIVMENRDDKFDPLTDMVLAVRDITAAYPAMDVTVVLNGMRSTAALDRGILRSIPRVTVFTDLLFDQLVSLVVGHELLLTDSYDMLDLASALGKPVLLTHDIERYEEWPQSESGKPIGDRHDAIFGGVQRVMSEPEACEDMLSHIHSNGDGFAAVRIGRLIANWARNGILTPMAFEPFRAQGRLSSRNQQQYAVC